MIARNKDLQDTSVTFPGGDRVRKLFYPLHNATQMSTTAPYNGTIARSISFDPMGRIRDGCPTFCGEPSGARRAAFLAP